MRAAPNVGKLDFDEPPQPTCRASTVPAKSRRLIIRLLSGRGRRGEVRRSRRSRARLCVSRERDGAGLLASGVRRGTPDAAAERQQRGAESPPPDAKGRRGGAARRATCTTPVGSVVCAERQRRAAVADPRRDDHHGGRAKSSMCTANVPAAPHASDGRRRTGSPRTGDSAARRRSATDTRAAGTRSSRLVA